LLTLLKMNIIDQIICGINQQILTGLNNPADSGVHGLGELMFKDGGLVPYIVDNAGNGQYIGIDNYHNIGWYHLIQNISFDPSKERYLTDTHAILNIIIPVYFNTTEFKARNFALAVQFASALPKSLLASDYNMSLIIIDAVRANTDTADIAANYFGLDEESARQFSPETGLFAIEYTLNLDYNCKCNPFCS